MTNKIKSLIFLALAFFCVFSFRSLIETASRTGGSWLTWMLVVLLAILGVIFAVLFAIYSKLRD